MNSREELKQLQDEFKKLSRLHNGLFAPLQQLPAQINELARLVKECDNEAQKAKLMQECSELKSKLEACKSSEKLSTINQYNKDLGELTKKIKALQIQLHGDPNPRSPGFLL